MAKKSSVNIPAIQVIRVIVFLFIGVSGFWIYGKISDFLTRSELFKVRDVVVDQSIQFIDMTELRQLKGRNIFKIDVVKLHKRIKSQYPQIAELRVMKEFPDRIKVLAKNREPIAQLVLKNKLLVIDEEGVALTYANAPSNLPLLQGMPSVKITLGAPVHIKTVPLAVAIIRGLQSRPHTSRLKPTSIDLSNTSQINVSMGPGFRVIIDEDNYRTKLELLDMLLAQRKIDFRRVKYLDLRFNEPVFGEEPEPKD